MADIQVMPCGCLMEFDEEDGNIFFIPHDYQCPYYLFILAEAERLGKPIEDIEKAPDEDG